MEEINRFNGLYLDLSEEDQALVNDIKVTAEILAAFIGKNQNRESAVAMTNFETAIMWAIKGICVKYHTNCEVS